jgi:uncharacterized membrane protein YphA (DoxX/SURF4 family)
MKFDRAKKKLLLSGFIFVVRVALGCLFIYGSLPKIRQPYDFLSSVYEYELLGPKAGMLVAMVLPWFELMVGVCLVGGIFVSGGLLACVIMAAAFTFAIASVLYRGLEISCGCFGATGDLITYWTLTRAVLVFLFSVLGYVGVVMLGPYGTAKEPSAAAASVCQA